MKLFISTNILGFIPEELHYETEVKSFVQRING